MKEYGFFILEFIEHIPVRIGRFQNELDRDIAFEKYFKKLGFKSNEYEVTEL